MELTDKKAIKMLHAARLLDVEESIDIYPEDEREGRDDFQMLADEAGYILSMYGEDTCYYDDLKQARYILSRTKYGKRIPFSLRTMKPIYTVSEIENAKYSVNEYNRLKRFVARLEKMGYISRW